MRMLDLFCGRWGWSKAFAARGWECCGIDLVEPSEIPNGCIFVKMNVLLLDPYYWGQFPNFICASPPCEQFSVWGMRHFHPNPPYPELGIKLFEHTRRICEASGVPYVIENVRAAQQFVGDAVHHCGPFYLWGTGVPTILNQGIKKGFKLGNGKAVKILRETGDRTALREYRQAMDCWHSSKSPKRIANTSKVATIPPELANCVADYAERLLEQRKVVSSTA